MLLTSAILVGGSMILGKKPRRVRRSKLSLAATLRPIKVEQGVAAGRKRFAVSARAVALGTLAAGGSALVLASANGYTPLVLARQLAVALQSSRYGPLLYIAADTIRPLTFFPDSLMTLISGLIFGPSTGFIVSYIGFGTSALVAYGVGRALRQSSPVAVAPHTPTDDEMEAAVEEPAVGYGGLRPLYKRYSGKMQAHPFTSMVLMHGMYLHADTVNCLAGYLGLAPRSFLAGAMLGVLPTLTASVLAGASLHGSLAAGALHFNPAVLVASGVLMVSSLSTAWYLQKSEI